MYAILSPPVYNVPATWWSWGSVTRHSDCHWRLSDAPKFGLSL